MQKLQINYANPSLALQYLGHYLTVIRGQARPGQIKKRNAAMAAIDTTRTAFGTASVAMRPGKWIQTLVCVMVDWNDARVTRKALSSLSDRELEDIGLIRGDIETVAKHRA